MPVKFRTHGRFTPGRMSRNTEPDNTRAHIESVFHILPRTPRKCICNSFEKNRHVCTSVLRFRAFFSFSFYER